MALTRAKRGMLVLGHRPTLCADPTWASWFEWVDKTQAEVPSLEALASALGLLDLDRSHGGPWLVVPRPLEPGRSVRVLQEVLHVSQATASEIASRVRLEEEHAAIVKRKVDVEAKVEQLREKIRRREIDIRQQQENSIEMTNGMLSSPEMHLEVAGLSAPQQSPSIILTSSQTLALETSSIFRPGTPDYD